MMEKRGVIDPAITPQEGVYQIPGVEQYQAAFGKKAGAARHQADQAEIDRLNADDPRARIAAGKDDRVAN
jgi:phage protein U